ncbi:hypothetical protein KCP70_24370 [Salmonella enterica subsp. enterica]|nr:hypothetical protein KCP70_24370 [Salmonella enterica subsp. enterica]
MPFAPEDAWWRQSVPASHEHDIPRFGAGWHSGCRLFVGGDTPGCSRSLQFAAEGKESCQKVALRPLEDINVIFKEMEQGQIHWPVYGIHRFPSLSDLLRSSEYRQQMKTERYEDSALFIRYRENY